MYIDANASTGKLDAIALIQYPFRMTATDEMALWARFLRTGRTVLAAVEGELKAAGLPPLEHYDALLELRRAAPGGLRPKALEARMLLAQYGISRLIDRLVRDGLAERRPCLEDRRGQIVTITPAGEALLARMWPVYRAAVARHFRSRLDPDTAAGLERALLRLSAPPGPD